MADHEPSGTVENLDWRELAKRLGLRVTKRAEALLDGLGSYEFLYHVEFVDIGDVPIREPSGKAEPKAETREVSTNIEVIKEYKPVKRKGGAEDFRRYFVRRLKKIREIFARRNLSGTLEEVKHGADSFVAMVYDKRITRKGDMVIEMEDEDTTLPVFISKDSPLFQTAVRIVEDEVVFMKGRMGKTFFIPNEILHPDLQLRSEPKSVPVPVAYISDLHFGSKLMEKRFAQRFIQWLKEDKFGRQVKYVVVAGDIVDGIGIYKGQEKELEVKDIDKQYALFNEFVAGFPDDVYTLVIPGNHDGIRRAEPHPSLASYLSGDVMALTNPAWVKIEGITHLIYHGTSLDGIISSVPGLSYDRPEEAMIELLKRRHLSPTFGKNLIVPEPEDYFVIDEVPDVFHAGHVHKNGYAIYRGVYVVNSGTFQLRTPFQVRMGHHPTPGRVAVLYGTKITEVKLFEEVL